jgi:hypothetical protein
MTLPKLRTDLEDGAWDDETPTCPPPRYSHERDRSSVEVARPEALSLEELWQRATRFR